MTHETSKAWRKRTVTWGKRLVLTILILGGVFYGVLSMAERSREPIRQGLQDYLEKETGHRAEITSITEVTLVPDVMFVMKGILLRDSQNREKSLVKAESAYISLPFSSMVFGSGKYYGFEVKKLEVATGYFLPKKLTLNFFGISHKDPGLGSTHFLMEGIYNNLPLMVTAEMFVNTLGKRPVYSFRDEFPVTLAIGPTQMGGQYVRRWDGIYIRSINLSREGIVADFDVSDIQKTPLSANIKGNIEGVPFTGTLKNQEDKMLLIINLDQASPQNFKTIERFISGIKKDLGLGLPSDPVIIDITQSLKE